jgi:DNA-binding CsgD family transcriptional regulator
MRYRDLTTDAGSSTTAGGEGSASANGISAAPLALALPPVFFLVGPNLGVRYASEPAEKYFRRGFPLSILGGRLTVHHADLKSELLPALRSASEHRRFDNGTTALRPLIDWRDPLSAALHVFRVTTMIIPGSDAGRSESLAGVFVDAPSVRYDPVELYAARYRLSRTEHRLLALLVAGHDLNSAALTLGQKISTTRTVLKKVFFKTDTHRQAELIRNVSHEQ